jgi:fucose permease
MATTTVRRHPGLLIGLAYAAFISLGLPDGLTGVAWPSIRSTFGLPLDALGALITTGTIGYLVSSFSSGRLLARVGVGWLLVLSCLATAVSLLGYGVAPLWVVMVALGLLAGLGAGAIDAGLNTYAAEQFSPRTMNWLHASFGLGAATGPLLMSGVISAGQPWKLGYLIVGVAQLLLASCFALTRTQWQTHHDEAQVVPTPSAPMLRTLGLPAAWLSILLFFLYTGLEITAGQWLYTLLTEARGMRPAVAGIWVSAYWGSLTVGRVMSGVVVERMTVRTLLWLCMAGALLGVALLWLNLAPWLALAGSALLGLSLAPMFPSFMSLTPARMGPAHVANTVGFQVSAAMLGGAALVSSFGLLAGRVGLEALGPFLLVTASLLTGVFALLERFGHTRETERAYSRVHND